MSRGHQQMQQESENLRQLEFQRIKNDKIQKINNDFKQTLEIDKVKNKRKQTKNDNLFYNLNNELVDNIKRKEEKLNKLKTSLKTLQIKEEQELEQRYYFLFSNEKKPNFKYSNNWYQSDPEMLQKRLDKVKIQIEEYEELIIEEQETGANLEKDNIQIFKINSKLKKNFEESQDIEYIQKVKFTNLENFHMDIQKKQTLSLINLHRCQKEFSEIAQSKDKGIEQKRNFHSTLNNNVNEGKQRISKNQIIQDEQKEIIIQQQEKIKSLKLRYDSLLKNRENTQQVKNMIRLILLLKQIFIENDKKVFVQKFETDKRLIDKVFDPKITNIKDFNLDDSIEKFFQIYTAEQLVDISDTLNEYYKDMNYTMTSMKNKYLNQSQQLIKQKEIYQKNYNILQEIIQNNYFLTVIDKNKDLKNVYNDTYFNYVSVDSGLIYDQNDQNIDTINIMNINKQEQDHEIVKFTKCLNDQEYLLLVSYNSFQILLQNFLQIFQLIKREIQIDLPENLQNHIDSIQSYFINKLNIEASLEQMQQNKDSILKSIQDLDSNTKDKLLNLIQNNSLFYSMLNQEQIQKFAIELNKNVSVEDQVDVLSSYAFETCHLRSKDLLDFIFQAHKIIKEESLSTQQKIRMFNMYNQSNENQKNNLQDLQKKDSEIYGTLKNTHEQIIKRIEGIKSDKKDTCEDLMVFNKEKENTKQKDDYENLKILIDNSCLLMKEQENMNKPTHSLRSLKVTQDLQNKINSENFDDNIKTDVDYIQYQRDKLKDMFAETEKIAEKLPEKISKQIQMVNDHLLMKNQFKNENIKQMKQDLKYIHKIDKLYNLKKGQLEKEKVFIETRQEKRNIQRSIKMDSKDVDNEFFTRISQLQTEQSQNRKREILSQRQRIKENQSQEIFYKTLNNQTSKFKIKQRYSASQRQLQSLKDLKAYF